MIEPYELGTAPPARRALAERLPPDIAGAAVEFVAGPLRENPRRVGKALTGDLAGLYSARLGREWRVVYEIDEVKRVVLVLDIQRRSVVYRPR